MTAVPTLGLAIGVEQDRGAYFVTASGEFDLSSVSTFNAALRNPRALACHTVVMDFNDVTFMDSSGLRAVLAARTRAHSRGQGFAVIHASRGVQELFRRTGVDRLLADTGSPLSP